MSISQKQAARKFVEYWTFQRGSEKGEDQQFWNTLLRDVLGVTDVEQHIKYQVPVQLKDTTKFLDAWIPETRVLIEHKSRGVNLDAPQAGHEGMTPYEQAVEYDNARSFDEKARWIVTCNFDEFRIYDRAKPLAPPVGVEEWQTIETRTFVYDDWNLIHETIYSIDGGTANTTEVQYFWGLDLSGTLQGAGGVGGLLAVSRNGQFYFPTYDNNGNVTKYIDEYGNIVAAYEYDDFGRTISQSGSLADFFRNRFSTKYHDPETSLYYYDRRFYSPEWRIWLNRDPIEELDCPNLHCSLGNNLISRIDPWGEAVKITTNPDPIRKASIEYREGSRKFSVRAVTRYSDTLNFSCDKRCILHVNGEMRLWIELLDENSPKWYDRLPQYRGNSEEREDLRTLSHEKDHYQTWKALFDFVKTANSFDGVKYTDCQARAARYNATYKKCRAITAAHSLKFDDWGWNMGGSARK